MDSKMISSTLEKVCFVVLLAMFIPSMHTEGSPTVLTNMSVYFQDFAGGPNATLAVVAGIPGKQWGFLNFGTVFVTDDPITEGMDKNSPEIGRAQGIYVTSSLDGGNTHVVFSIVFTNKLYNGSTLELQGRSIQLAKVREVSIVSGTGQFRLSRGYATFETVYYEPSIFYSIIRCNLTVFHSY